MQATARAIARIDCLYSLACAAYDNRYVRPSLNTKATISIKDGRHPIIEKYLKDELFVPNDVTLNHEDHEILVITRVSERCRRWLERAVKPVSHS